MAGAAGEHQLVVDTILLRVEQVGAIKSQRDVLEPKMSPVGTWEETYHSRQNLK